VIRKKLVAGNWKMNGCFQDNAALLDRIKAVAEGLPCEVTVCVPFPFIGQARQVLSDCPISWGAQNVSEHAAGAYTGEVSVAMLAEFGCKHVIVGHSERRALFAESDKLVAAKAKAVVAGGLVPIVCVGETRDEREAGQTMGVVARQLCCVLDALDIKGLSNVVLAYEPVWAIGTGLTASPQEVQEVHAGLRALVADRDTGLADGLRILYGGSVKPQNAAALFSQQDVDGGLIGGAALVADDFIAICRSTG
jgi:triosephosphate isomerase (TIM)